ncbi:MAG: selenide, water dikinase SelD [Mariniblastus sp.]|nr:selenide, water dikinase SelD [Mariniblastus sp.]MDG2180341.1 selenide, water dikinase SelD [Mariniblastus sp.]
MQKKLGRNTVVLLGIGHTNAHVLRKWKMKPLENAELVCVSNFPISTYSGMLPGALSGQYPSEKMEIDLVRLCASAGVRLILDEVVGVDPLEQRLLFRNRPSLAYDALSIGVGSVPTFGDVEISDHNPLISVKPMQTFLSRLRDRLEACGGGGNPRVAVVGGGIGSIEIALCLDQRMKTNPTSLGLESGQQCDISLITGGDRIGAGLLESTRDKVESHFQRRGIKAIAGSRVAQITPSGLVLKNGATEEADVVIWATSAIAPPILKALSLESDERGFVLTKSTLQSTSSDQIFAVGDSGTMQDQALVKAGVFAVRQGPFLWDNIRRLLENRKLVNYVPQANFLKLINTADGSAIGEYKSRSFQGRWCWALKNRIDLKFMKMYQDYSPMEMAEVSADPEDVMRCLGCGGKIGSKLLGEVLKELEVPAHEDVIIGLENPDDAAVIRTHGGQVTVTTDFFASPMDDPYLVGQIALLNSASDCCVMGAQPTSALAIVQLPLGHPRAQLQVMRELMAGSVAELKKMNATIVGGHSIEGPRLTAGFTVLGRQLTDPKTKGMLEEGDLLVSTKPLGTGVLLAALMQGLLPGKSYLPLVNTMLLSNYIAIRLIQDYQISAITDVTGFGMAGHLAEMLKASGKSATIRMDEVRLLPGCQALIDAGIESTLAPDNRLVTDKVQFIGDAALPANAALFDPQTSGGLLFGIAESRLPEVLDFLGHEGFEETCVIGEVTANPAATSALTVVS